MDFFFFIGASYYYFFFTFLNWTEPGNTFWFFISDVFLLFSLLGISLQISLQPVVSRFTFLLTPFLVLRRLVNIFWFSLILLIVNPYTWFFTKFLYNDYLMMSPSIALIKLFILFTSILILRSSFFYSVFEKYQTGDFFIFFGFLVFFLLIFVQVIDFFFLFLIFEVISILLYLLILHSRQVKFAFPAHLKYSFILNNFSSQSQNSRLSVLSSILYFLVNIFVSIFYLFSLIFLFVFFRTANFYVILFYLVNQQQFSVFLFFIFFFLLFMFFYKFALVPFHWWISAVFESSSLLVLMFISIPMKLAFFFMFFRVFLYFFSFFYIYIQVIINIISLISMFVGVMGLLFHQNLKKFWAYSTINHMGYLLLALNSFCFLGLRAFFVYLLFYILVNFLFFFIFQCLINERLNQRIIFLNQLVLLVPLRNSWLLFFFSLLVFSLIGLPPLLGFWAKYLVLCSILVSFSVFWSYCLVFVIFLTTVISAFCYLKLWKNLFLEKAPILRKNNFYLIPIPITNIVFLFCFSFLFFYFSIIFFFNETFYLCLDKFICFSLLDHVF